MNQEENQNKNDRYREQARKRQRNKKIISLSILGVFLLAIISSVLVNFGSDAVDEEAAFMLAPCLTNKKYKNYI